MLDIGTGDARWERDPGECFLDMMGPHDMLVVQCYRRSVITVLNLTRKTCTMYFTGKRSDSRD